MARGLPGPTGRPGTLWQGARTRPPVTGHGEGERGARVPSLRSQPVSNRRTQTDGHDDNQDSTSTRGRHTFVLDTSVLIADPAAFLRFAEHDVVLPLVVISELEGKRNHPELGYFARQSLRMLDDLRVRHTRLDQPITVNEAGGTLRVELNHTDPGLLPAGFRNDSNDARILSVALGLAAEGQAVTLVTKDMPLRVKAGAVGLL